MALPLENGVVRLTAVLVTGAFCLIGAGATGLDGSLPLFLVLVALAAALYLAGPPLADTPLARLDRPGALEDLWAGPAVAAAVVLPFLGASPGEVRALGGLLGLVGMVNYFLRPVYHLVYGLVARVADVGGQRQ